MIVSLQKYFKNRFGHAAPQVTVKAHMPTRWKIGIALGSIAAVGGLIWGGFDYGRILAGFNVSKIEEEKKQLAADITRLTEENETLKKRNVTAENDAKVAVGAKDAMSQQIIGLQTEVTQLREEVSFFQKLTSGSVKDGALAIQKLQFQREPGSGNWRVRALVTQGGTGNGDFRGTLSLNVSVMVDGKQVTILLPDEQKTLTDSLKLAFKTHQRVEAVFNVPQGGEVQSIQAKLIANGSSTPRAQFTATL